MWETVWKEEFSYQIAMGQQGGFPGQVAQFLQQKQRSSLPTLECDFPCKEEGVHTESHHTPHFSHIMGCGDSKDRKTVQAKPQTQAPSQVAVPVPADPDEEAEVLTRAKRLGTIEPAPVPVDEDVPEKPVEVTQLTEPAEVKPVGVKFKGGVNAVEALEVLEASLSEHVPEKFKDSHVDDLLEDVLGAHL